MKKTITVITSALVMALILSACSTPTYPSSDSVKPGSSSAVTQNEYSELTINPVNATLGSSYMRGIDASEVRALEENGQKFYNSDDGEQDVFAILAANGVNWIRLRIWNDYTQELSASWAPYGYNNLARTINMAQRAKKYGMKVLLDFHYSDTWADPSKQKCPAMWSTIDNAADMGTAVAKWTTEILTKMKAAGCAPDMVQLGNEMEGGLFLTGGAFVPSTSGTVTILTAAATAVRTFDSNCLIMLHMSRGGNSSVLSSFLTNYATKVDCDVVGLSYYPFYTTHGTITNLKTNIATIVGTSAYANGGKLKAVIAETSFAYGLTYTDTTSNEFWTSDTTSSDDEVIAASLLTTYPGITTDSSGNKRIVASVANQAGVIREIIEKSASSGATGIFCWGSCYLGIDKVMPSSWENQAFFDVHGKVLPSLKVMSVAGTN